MAEWNPLDPLGLFEGLKRDVERLWATLGGSPPTGAEVAQEQAGEGPDSPLQDLAARMRSELARIFGTLFPGAGTGQAGDVESGNPGGNPGHNPAVRFVGVGPPPPRPGVKPVEERRPRPRWEVRKFAFVTPEERQRMLELRAEGLDYREIADRMGRSLSVVWRQINLPGEPRYRAITPQHQQDAILMRRMGLSLKEIGQRMRVSDAMARYILHRAGERVDLIEAAQMLNERLVAVSEDLRPPATYDKLTDAAERVRRIGDDAALIGEITPEEVPRPLQDYPYEIGWIHSRALLAEEVLNNGAWCTWASEQEVLPPFPTPPQEELGRPLGPLDLPTRVSPAYRERLRACAEAARDIARGVIQGWEGYEVKAEQTVRLIEEMMAVSAAEVPEPREVPA